MLPFFLVPSLWMASPAHAVGLAGAAGVVVFDNKLEKVVEDTPEVEVSFEPMVGPLVSVALRAGDWVDHQAVLQWTGARGAFTVHETAEGGADASGSTGLSTFGVGYQLGLDIGGKEGFSRLSPCLAVGFVVGGAWIRLTAHSDDPDVQSDLEEEGYDDRRESTAYLAVHALAGLRVRVSEDVGIRGVVARSTTGGIASWQPQIVVDVTPGGVRKAGGG
jgi:hypothetical protein